MIPLDRASKIAGMMKPREMEWLRNVALRMPRGARMVEVGCWKGRSTAAIGVDHIALFCVDTFAGIADNKTAVIAKVQDIYSQFLDNMKLAKLSPFILKMRSTEAAGRFPENWIDWIFFNSDHRDLDRELSSWFGKVKRGGLISGHDYKPLLWPGIVNTLRDLPYPFAVAPRTSIWWFYKP